MRVYDNTPGLDGLRQSLYSSVQEDCLPIPVLDLQAAGRGGEG